MKIRMRWASMTRVGTCFLILVCLTSCKQDEQTVLVDTKTNVTDEVIPPFTLNSDGSKTYLATQNICNADIPNMVRGDGCLGGSSLSFYTVGQNFIGLDRESLVVEKLTLNGKDIRKRRNLEVNAKIASNYSKASDDGTYLSWKVTIPEGYHSANEQLKLSGHITGFRSQKLIELTSSEFDITNFDGFKMGEILVRGTGINRNIKDNFTNKRLSDDDVRLIGDTLNKFEDFNEKFIEKEIEKAIDGLGIDERKMDMVRDYLFFNSFSEIKDEELISLRVKAKHSSLHLIEIYSDEVKLNPLGYISSSNAGYVTRTYHFERESTQITKVKLKVFYWENPEPFKLNFNF